MHKYIILISIILSSLFGYSQITEGTITIDSPEEVKDLVTKKIIYNASHISKSTYRIQLFYGSENNAIRIQNNFRALFPTTSCNLVYDSPNWKVKVGNYKTRLKADKHLQEVILEFGDAIVLEPNK